MRISLFLADFAQSDDKGKINTIGLGWTTTATPLQPFALVIFLDIDWDETNQPHPIRCELLTEDGQPARVPGPVGLQPLVFEASAEAGRPPGTPHGTAIRMPLAVNLSGGIPLPPGRYEWRASVKGFENATASESFLVYASDGPAGSLPHGP